MLPRLALMLYTIDLALEQHDLGSITGTCQLSSGQIKVPGLLSGNGKQMMSHLCSLPDTSLLTGGDTALKGQGTHKACAARTMGTVAS